MRITVRVKPGAKSDSITAASTGYQVTLKAQPVDGKANVALIALLAKHFGVRKRDVSVRSGHGSRIKIVDIENL